MRKLFDVVRKLAVHRSQVPKTRRAFSIEPIEPRLLLSVTATFNPGAGVLSVFGDNADNNIVVSRNAAGSLLVNSGAVAISGGAPTVANTSLIQAFGQGGDDVIALDESNGALPLANLFGEAGDDVLTGGSGDDLLFGQSGNDTLLGKGGNDQLFGGADNDTLTGGDGDDQIFGENGDDRMIWNPGDDTDLNEGGDGTDTVEVNGGNGAEAFTLTANGTRVRFDRVNPAPFSLDIGTTENFVLNANGGDDNFSASGNLAALIQITVDGGAGNDTLLGSNGSDTLLGGDGNDLIDGNQGNDVALLGAGDDTFQWDPGDGSDIVEGQAGTDTLLFNASNANEIMEVSANGGRALFTRNVGNIVMDINDVERLNVNALGGIDTVTVNDLTGTDVTEVNLKLAGTIGGTTGDAQSDTVVVAGTNGGDVIEVVGAGGAYTVTGLTAVVNVTESESLDSLIINALSGPDTVSASALTPGVVLLRMDGGDGNDTLRGGSSAEILAGGAGNDTLVGGGGDDQVFGDSGDDRMIWNPGDGTDLNEGGDGNDTVEVNGGNGAEVFTLTANGARVRFDRVSPAPFSLDIGTTENLVLNANGGDDSFSATGNLAALIQITVDGGAGNDTLLGSNGSDILIGGDGNDLIDGNQGNDVALLGAGDDTFQWDPGDGSDIVEGQAGTDTLLFNASNANEIMEVSANGGRALFTRNVGNIVMDLNDVERLNVNALGGIDTVTVNDLTGTDVTEVNLKLAGTIGGTTGDAQADTVVVAGTNGADGIGIFGAGGAYTVTGLAALVNVTESESADSLIVNALGGPDTVLATGLAAGVARLTIDAGTGDDAILGSPDADILIGGDGNDFVDGNQGSDLALLGTGDDTFQWDPGDGSDTIEGQAGSDTLVFNGSNANERFDVSANGGRLRFTRDVGNITMDLNDVERIDLNALGGADAVTVNDLTGTDVSAINVNLAAVLGGGAGDGQADTIVVNGTAGDDVIHAVGTTSAFISGLPAAVFITSSEAATDRLSINALAGNDVVDASGLGANLFALEINGGAGADLLLGSQGSDQMTGGQGTDTALMGAGNDTFVWNPGDGSDTIEGQAGSDALLFNGANVSERVDIAANGGRVRFTRDIAAVTMDMDDVETILFNALGGADNIAIHDLSGTDVTTVKLALAAAGGGGDGQVDAISIDGTSNADNIKIKGSGSDYSVTGLPALLKVTGSEAIDTLTVNGLGGNDTITASTLPAGTLRLTLDGGAGNDTLVGSFGDDFLLGGDGDDVLIGGPGNDVLDGGPGDDTEIQ